MMGGTKAPYRRKFATAFEAAKSIRPGPFICMKRILGRRPASAQRLRIPSVLRRDLGCRAALPGVGAPSSSIRIRLNPRNSLGFSLAHGVAILDWVFGLGIVRDLESFKRTVNSEFPVELIGAADRIFWNQEDGCFACNDKTIDIGIPLVKRLLGDEWVEDILRSSDLAYDPSDESYRNDRPRKDYFADLVLIFYLGHEYIHLVQNAEYGLSSSAKISDRERELQADFLSAYFIGTRIGSADEVIGSDTMEELVQLGDRMQLEMFLIGDESSSAVHGTPGERMILWKLGTQLGSYSRTLALGEDRAGYARSDVL
jgi:hypothetical protein